ncbi:uracil-DNA glycosylase-like protein, partial [Cladochytrium replicatum]
AIEIRQTNLLLATEKENMAPDWFKVFESEMKKEYFTKIKQTLLKERENNAIVFPPENEIYTFTKCPLKNVRVVILGQDPYHGPGQAHGLCFSVKMGVKPPPSLVNIFKELQSDLGPDGFKIPDHGYLEGWCSQGVLLLNAALTVRKAEPNSHQKIGWATFTDAIVDHINKNMTNVVFMLWGGDAQKKGAKVDKKKHFVLKAVHPSPLSAHRGFLGCKHFSKANEYLKSRGRPLVDWNKL